MNEWGIVISNLMLWAKTKMRYVNEQKTIQYKICCNRVTNLKRKLSEEYYCRKINVSLSHKEKWIIINNAISNNKYSTKNHNEIDNAESLNDYFTTIDSDIASGIKKECTKTANN
ncbi:hypothetical protein PR048_019344, partial [Dryococelus australis]